MASLSPINIDTAMTSDVPINSESVSGEGKTGKKDTDALQSENQAIMSLFSHMLQNRINTLDKTEKKVAATSMANMESAKEVTAKGKNSENTSPLGSLTGNQKGATEETGKQMVSLADGNAAVAEELGAESLKDDAFIKKLMQFLKDNGASEEKVEQALSQIKKIMVSAKDELSQNAYSKEMTDFLKNHLTRERDIQNMLGSLKGNAMNGDTKVSLMEQVHEFLAKQGVTANGQGFSSSGAEISAAMILSSQEMAKISNSAADDGLFAMKNNFTAMMDQGRALNMNGNENIANTATLPNLRPQQLIEQIVNARQLLDKNSGRVMITLTPPSLGTLDMDVRVRNNRVELSMTADNKDVKQILQLNIDDLKTALRDQGLFVDRLNVQWQNGDAGMEFSGFDRGNSLWNGNNRQGQNSGEESESISSLIEVASLKGRSLAEAGSGRISVIV